jgi:hypothetical protein
MAMEFRPENVVGVGPSQLGAHLNAYTQDANRIARYLEHWRFYYGKQWAFTSDNDNPLVTLNLFKKVIDKSVSFLVSKGINFKVADPLVDVTPPFLREVWKRNGGDRLLWDMGIMGAVSGDVFMLVTYKDPDPMQRRIFPYSKGKVLLRLLDSSAVYPIYDPLDPGKLLSVRIETMYMDSTELTTDGKARHRRYVEVITPETITLYLEDREPVEQPNILGEIPLVHIKNLPSPGEVYGIPDGLEIIDVQREINEKATDLSDIVNYHASPITVVIGAKAKELERGPKQIWTGLPKDAQVFNLALQGDLGAGKEYLDMLRSLMMELSDTPEGALGKMHPISNTSGVAMHMQYGPLVEKTEKKRAQYAAGIDQINYFILRIGHVMGMLKLPFDIDKKSGGKIAEVEVPILAPNGEQAVDEDGNPMVERQARVFAMDPETFEFTKPEDMKVRFVRQYSFGHEIREAPFWQVVAEHRNISKSFWDPEPEAVDGSATRPMPQMSADQITIPEEPEDVTILVQQYDAQTGDLVREDRVTRLLVPVKTTTPEYLNPYETETTFNDALPKDKHLDAQLYRQYLEMGVVSKRWVQEQIADIAPDIDEIARDKEEERAELGNAQPTMAAPLEAPQTDLQNTSMERMMLEPEPVDKRKERPAGEIEE